jgi:hypothetical protein
MIQSQSQVNSLQNPPSKIISHTKRADGMAQVVECLPSNHEALNSNFSAKKKKIESLWKDA